MSSVADFSCYDEMVEKYCPSCFLVGGEFFRLQNNSHCCTFDLSIVNGEIVKIYEDVTSCPVVGSGGGTGFELGIASMLPLALGAVAAGSIFAAGCCLWKCVSQRLRARRATPGINYPGGYVEEIELVSLATPIVSQPSSDTSFARQAATLLNPPPTAVVVSETQDLFTGDRPRSYGNTRGGSSAGSGITVTNPLYDQVSQVQVEEEQAFALPPVPARGESFGAIDQQRQTRGYERGNQFAVMNKEGGFRGGAPLPIIRFGEEAGTDAVDEAEDERMMQKLRMWGRAGKVKFTKKRSDSSSLCEYEF